MVAFALRNRAILTTPFFLIGLALAGLGCARERSPTSSDQSPAAFDVDSASAFDSKVYLVFSPRALDAAKVTDDDDDEWLRTSKVARPNKKTRLRIRDDDLSLKLVIPKGAVEERVRIRMAVRPSPLSSLVVEMGPSGQVFYPSATLTLELDAELVDMDLSKFQPLIASYGVPPEAANIISVDVHGDDDDDGDGSASFESVTIVIEVPHFSRYGLRNSYIYPLCEPHSVDRMGLCGLEPDYGEPWFWDEFYYPNYFD